MQMVTKEELEKTNQVESDLFVQQFTNNRSWADMQNNTSMDTKKSYFKMIHLKVI